MTEAAPLPEITAAATQPGLKLPQIVATVMEGYADRPALGQRATELMVDPASGRTRVQTLSRFDTITYRELWSRVAALAAEWLQHPQHPLRAGDFVGTLGFTSTDYTTVELACIYTGAVSVPLQTSAPVQQHIPIVAETAPHILAVGIDYLDDAVEAILSGTAPRRLIVFDYHAQDDDQRERFDRAQRRLVDADDAVVVESLAELLDRGKSLPPVPVHVVDADDDPLVTLIYTSGSTGTPKGAMYTDRIVRSFWLRPARVPMVALHYMPMSHQFGRGFVARTLFNGGVGYFTAHSDLSALFDDIALVRPTAVNLVPRVCDMIFQQYLAELDRRTEDGADPEGVDRAVKAHVRENFLGGRIVSATCGSAPLSAEMHAFIEACLDVHLTIGYGTTEIGGVTLDNVVQRSQVIDYKLIDVPELGYFRTDKPHPRGELLVKTKTMMPGYYNRPEITASVFDDDGFYCTGDIMAQIGPDKLSYVDRRNNILKLSQGEFVAISQLEAAFANSPLIQQIFLYGNSERSFLLAVVVPADDQIRCDRADEVKAAISASLHQIAHDAGLKSYEIPREFLLESQPFTLRNGLLTGGGKLARPQLKAYYGTYLEQMYAQIADEQANELRALRTAGRDRPVLETLTRAVVATLGLSAEKVSAGSRFSDLGGDSLSALSLSTLLEQIFAVEVPVGAVIDPTADLRQIAKYIEIQRNSNDTRATFASVHGGASTEVHATDMRLDKFIDSQILKQAPTVPRASDIGTVLLTGATGFLGRFLAVNWLERLSGTGGVLICIARGSDAAQARQRLEDGLATDSTLLQRFRALAADHLEVIPGDIGEPGMGLDDATWNRLALRVDLIVHAAAHVNHMLPYKQLFAPNVVGTAELVRLAITHKIKPLNYVSSMGAASVGTHAIDEAADIRLASPMRKLGDSYAGDYSATKWAGEVLMREAHDLCGVPVIVFRPDMILAHSSYVCQLNVPDMFTRLMFSLASTGVAPRSFYRRNTTENRPHYDGLPVDFVADAAAALGAESTDGFCTFNVVNHHDDGISLDNFVDWLIEADCPIQRIDDYYEWVTRFETAIRGLPDKQRQHSVLMVMDAFRHPAEAIPGGTVPSDAFQQAISSIRRDVPHLSAALIRKYHADLSKLGLL